MRHIYKCKNCKIYTTNIKCPKCGIETTLSIPPKYSPDDKYASYRRKVKSDMLKKEGLI